MQPVAPIANATYISGFSSNTTQGHSVYSSRKENKIKETLHEEEASNIHLKPFPNMISGSSQIIEARPRHKVVYRIN